MRKFDDVERLGKEEVEGILNDTCYIFEKIDGANISFYWDIEKGLCIASRNTEIYSDKNGGNFRNIVEWLEKNPNIREIVKDFTNFIFYGEYLIKHKIQYPPECMNKVWFFDIYNKELQKYLYYNTTKQLFQNYDISYIPCLGFGYYTKEQLELYMNINNFKGNPSQEGIVIKNYNFVNKFGRTQWAKMVNSIFQEVKEKNVGIKEGIEDKIVENYITMARVEKICSKLKNELCIYKSENKPCPKVDMCNNCVNSGTEVYNLSGKDIPRIIEQVFYDVIQEDIWDIIKKYKLPIIDFKKLRKLSTEKTKSYFMEIIKC